ncbi:MAG TPA: hypothetical protein VGJ28_13140 [Micromonosporaceae bacterium]
MTVIETVSVFVLIPLAVVLLTIGAVYAQGAARGKRYRPGRPFASNPVWYLAEPTPQVEASHARALVASGSEAVHHGEVGGASDSW